MRQWKEFWSTLADGFCDLGMSIPLSRPQFSSLMLSTMIDVQFSFLPCNGRGRLSDGMGEGSSCDHLSGCYERQVPPLDGAFSEIQALARGQSGPARDALRVRGGAGQIGSGSAEKECLVVEGCPCQVGCVWCWGVGSELVRRVT